MYSSRFLLILFIVCLLLPLQVKAEPGEPAPLSMNIPSGTLTLKTAQRQARAASPRLEQALARIQAAQAIFDQARSTLKPRINLYAGYRRQKSSMQPDWAPEIRVRDSFNHWGAGLQVNWLIFNGFSRRALVLASQHQVEASEQNLVEAQRLLAEAVSSAFYQAQLAVEGMYISKQNQIFNRSLEAEADKRWQVGSIPESEKLNFSVKVLQAESSFLRAKQNFATISTVLAELMALPKAELPRKLYPVRSSKNSLSCQSPSFDDEFAYALDKRPDLKVLQAQIDALQENKKVEQGTYWPKVILNGGFDYKKITDLDTTDQDEHDLYAGLNLSWDLYKGGERSAKIREVEKEIQGVRQQHRQAVLAIQSAIRRSIDVVTATRARYERQKRSLVLTARIRDHVEKAYRAGVAILTRLNEVQTDLVRAAGAEASSRINYQLALQQLDAASGRILENMGH